MSDPSEEGPHLPQTVSLEVSRTSASGGPQPSTEAALEVETPLVEEVPGRYQLGAELARGGQAVVYVAYDSHLGREVAFKTLLAERQRGGSATTLSARAARFVREARVTAQLEHPGIAPVHEVGRRADGAFYATQKLVRGKTLAALLAECRTAQDRFRLLPAFLGICQAVAYAHQRGVIHRDLKPANVMVGALGEAVVIDWGLARSRGPEAPASAGPPVESLLEGGFATQDGAIVGTPAYMSPEQAVGAAGAVDERGDVWSLGVVLYELLGGRRPYGGASAGETLQQVATSMPAPIRSLCPEVSPELAAVVERALQRDPGKRYPQAGALAEEVGRWLSGDRVVAYEYRSWELVQRFVRRNRTSSALGALVVLALAASAVATRARYLESRRQLAESYATLADVAATGLRWDVAAAWFAASRVQEDSLRARLGLAYARSQAPRPLANLDLPGLTFGEFCPLPDGGVLATAFDAAGAQLLDAQTGAVRARFGVPGVGRALCALEVDRVLTLSGASDTAVAVQGWTLDGRPLGVRWSFPGSVDSINSAVLSADGQLLAVQDAFERSRASCQLRAFAVPGGRLLRSLESGTAWPSFQGPQLSWIDPQRWLWRGDPRAGEPARRRQLSVNGTTITPLDGGGALVAGRGGVLEFVPASAEEDPLSSRASSTSRLLTTALSPDGEHLASSSDLGTEVALWDRSGPSLTQVAVMAGFGTGGASVFSPLVFSADGARVLAGIARSSTRVRSWLLPDRAGDRFPVTGGVLELSPDGQRLAFSHERSDQIEILEVATRRPLGTIPYTGLAIWRQSLAFSAGGDRLAVLQRKQVEVYDLARGAAPRLIASVPARNPPIALSPDGRTLIVNASLVDDEGSDVMALWDVGAGAPRLTVPVPTGMNGVAFNGDGTQVAAAGDGVFLFDARSGRVLRRWTGPSAAMRVALGRGGRTLAVGGLDGVWRMDVEADQATQLAPDCSGYSVAISADGEWIASSSSLVSVWRGASPLPVLEFPEEGRPEFVGLSPDGHTLFHGGPRVQRLRLPLGPSRVDPEDDLADVLRTYRLTFDGRQVAPDLR